ncbi:Hypothetical protein PP7435_CHR3-0652 [Komagataella phaffii CBS 7435]|uniref:Uncharacterized protein n=2 Tax=Komagataella phaffii TaxID=460519 RepID=C4R4W7_KOMPG|nr:Hypothetical protein PAS_chr3_0553 [Komagataella phaffii GS115]AOA64255.1 GQ67_03628T0 [Komagataella phaffii]CAH2449633.1 Hypothetical protein BQ9382_C3-3465 [Komagataella phaffii CBS 7435]AOA68518.1 GQ68_03600T0 [Komagataella phaffii GS115]CAY70603.1 Hypothetical protein PAS_chr3_0553 [Komagataella phaffii GS115]CCA39609.1 Hypothetical protein PP7435_CHR3-0652 [Komagataella phaffii CBS 7435]
MVRWSVFRRRRNGNETDAIQEEHIDRSESVGSLNSASDDRVIEEYDPYDNDSLREMIRLIAERRREIGVSASEPEEDRRDGVEEATTRAYRPANTFPVDQRPVTMRFWDAIGATVFPILLVRIIKELFSVTVFSSDIIRDTEEFFNLTGNEVITKFSTASPVDTTSNKSQRVTTSLILKFYRIFISEMSFLNADSGFLRLLTISTFYTYTALASMFMVTAVVFLLACSSFTIGRRLHLLQTLAKNLFTHETGVF